MTPTSKDRENEISRAPSPGPRKPCPECDCGPLFVLRTSHHSVDLDAGDRCIPIAAVFVVSGELLQDGRVAWSHAALESTADLVHVADDLDAIADAYGHEPHANDASTEEWAHIECLHCGLMFDREQHGRLVGYPSQRARDR